MVAAMSFISSTTGVHVLGIGERQVHYVIAELHAAVGERRDRAVRNDVDRALFVPEHRRPQVDLFDESAGAVDRHHVADTHLVLEDQEEPANQILDQALRAEAERDADDAGAGQSRRDVDLELVQDHQ
jgi:hypothetical protein